MSAEHSVLDNPNLTVGIALAAGIFAQSMAHHLRVPGIVLLLGLGVVLGPDVLGVVRPETLGSSLASIVGFAVAVILFEGGMNLDIPRIKRAGAPIRRLITIGALVTAVGATVAVRAIMQWDWSLSVLFGTLVVVTGPTVVTPLLKRLRVEREVGTILEAEGVLIDPIGAILAVVALGVVTHPGADTVLLALPDLAVRLGVGTILGMIGGGLISVQLKWKGWIPDGLHNVFALTSVVALFQVSESVMHESGIAAVTIAGIAVRYLGTPVEREVLEFKEQLTVMLIGMLFILLAADVRLAQVEALGLNGLAVVATLVLIVRPLNVLAGTLGTGLSWRQQAFLAYVAPRGIVAAAVASLFAVQLEAAGLPGGPELRALVFLTIAITVVLAGLTGGMVAWLLGVREPPASGWVILGAHELGLHLAKLLTEHGLDVTLVDANPEHVRAAQEAGLKVIQGNALKDSTLLRTEVERRSGVIGMTRNEEVNFLFTQKARSHARGLHALVSLDSQRTGVTEEMLHHADAHLLFGGPHDVERWNTRISNGRAVSRVLEFAGVGRGEPPIAPSDLHYHGSCLPIAVVRGGVIQPMSESTTLKRKDRLLLLVEEVGLERHLQSLGALGLKPVEQAAANVEDVEAT